MGRLSALKRLVVPHQERMRRASAAGFDEAQVFHGTARDFDAFDLSRGGATTGASGIGRLGVSVTDDAEVASEFASRAARGEAGANVMPLRIRADKRGEIRLDGTETNLEVQATLQDAWDQGFDAVKLSNYTTPGGLTGRSMIVVRDPAQLRSVNAAFDPARRMSPNLLAGGAAAAVGLGMISEAKADETMGATAEDLRRRIGAIGARSSADALKARISAAPATPSANFVAREMAARGVINSFLAAPSASGDLLAAASAGLQQFSPANAFRMLVNKWRGVPDDEQPTFRERLAEEKEKFPASALRAIPRPTWNDIWAGAQSIPSLMPGGETPREAFARNRDELDREEFAMREAHPTAATVGDVTGDIASLFLARRGTGIDKAVRRFETRMGARESAAAATSLADDVGKIVKGSAFRSLARGAGRSIETGIEAAVLDIVKDPNADPVETAAIAAGAQMVGSGLIGGAQGLMSGGPTKAGLKLAVAAASTMGLLQVLKSATPGGQDRILESIESGYDKVALALGLGAASAAIGLTRFGRGNTALSDQTRTFLDGIGTAHRGTSLSLLTRWNDADPEERETIERVLTAVSNDPHYRGQNAAERRVVSQLRNRYRTGGGF